MANRGREVPLPPDSEERLLELKAEDDRLARQIAALRARRRELAAQIRTISGHVTLTREMRDAATAVRALALHGGTIADAAAIVLKERGPTRVSDLVVVLQEAGKVRRSEWAYTTVATSLARDPRFRPTPGQRGAWQLRDPGG